MKKKAELAALAAIVLIGLVLRSRYLNRADLWGDEATSWAAASGSLSELGARIAALEVKPPLYSLALHLWIAVFGDGEVAMRCLSAAFWPPCAAFLWLLGGRVCARRALLPPLLSAISPLLVYYGVEVRHYSMLLCAETAFLWLAVRADQDRTRSSRIWLAVASFMTMSCQFTGAFFVAPVLLALLVPLRRSPRDLVGILVPQAAAAAVFILHLGIFVPGLFAALRSTEGRWWASDPSWVQVLSSPVRLLAPVVSWKDYLVLSRVSSPVLLLSAGFLTALAAVGLCLSSHRRILLAATAGALGLVVAYSLLRANLLFERYYIGCAPALLVGVACALDPLSRTRPALGNVLAAGASGCQILLLILLPPFQGAAVYREAVDSILSGDRGRLTILTSGWDSLSVRYYARKEIARVTLRPWTGRIDDLSTDPVPLYFLTSRSWGDRTGTVRSALSGGGGVLVPVHDAGGTTVYRWDRVASK